MKTLQKFFFHFFKLKRTLIFLQFKISVADSVFHFDADSGLDPTFHSDADLDPIFQFNADPDPTTHFFQIWTLQCVKDSK
jgi:hypothetical protein